MIALAIAASTMLAVSTVIITMADPQNTTAMIGANAQGYLRFTITSFSTVMPLLSPNPNSMTDGIEQHINSGYIWLKDKAPRGLSPMDSYSVKFEKAGTYD
jgi:hypothetical protein